MLGKPRLLAVVLLLAFAVFAAGSAAASVPAPNVTCVSDPNIFNTGYDAATGGILPNNSPDANWQVTPVQDAGTGTPTVSLPSSPTWIAPLVGNQAPGAWFATPYHNANWIQNRNDPNNYGDWYYMYQFNLDPSVDPSTFSLEMNFLADNSVDEVFVNGVAQSTQTTGLPQLPRPWDTNPSNFNNNTNPYYYQGYSGANAAQTTLSHNWQTGLNTIIVQIKSGPPAEGFDAAVRPSAVCPVNVTISKTAFPAPYVAGHQLTYRVTVQNSGPGNASGLSVTDPLPAALAGGNFTWTCTATANSSCAASGTGSINDVPSGSYPGPNVYPGGAITYTVTGTVPAAASGTIANTAIVAPPPGTVDPGCTPSCSSSATAPQASPSISITKIADAANGDQTPVSVGEKIRYSYLVTNTGNDALPTISVSDPTDSGATCPTPPAPGLAAGASETCTANVPYIVTQSDVDNGGTSDTATASCTDQYGNACPPSNPSSTHTPSSPSPAVALQKIATVTPAADQNAAKVGDSIQYTYRVTNTGNVDLIRPEVFDPNAGFVACPPLAAPGLAPGASETCKGAVTHRVTQADVDAGQVVDTATATCFYAPACPRTPPSTAIVPTVAAAPSASIQKIADASGGDQAPITLGETIKYFYLVRNTGVVTLKTVSVNDPTAGSVTCPTPAGGLPPGRSETCTADKVYTVTQADVNNGNVTDTATVNCADTKGLPCGPEAPSVIVVPGNPSPSVAVDKTATVSPASDANGVRVGDMITYAYTVTNTGNVDETSVSVSDPTLGKVNCPAPAAPGLAPGSSETCTAATTVTVSQRDVDAGSLTDTATAGCLDALGAACGPSTQSTVVIPAVSAEPLTSVKKTATITRQADRHKARRGDKIRYSFKVTNIGNVDLTTVRVTDTTLGAVSCPVPLAPGLAPGASETCTGKRTYRVSGADVTAGKVVNDATSTGTDPQGQVSAVSNQTQTTVATIAAGPMLTKTPSVRRARAGGKVTYTLIVRNRSAIAMSSVTVCDSLPQTLLFDRASPRARLSTGRYCWSLRRLAGHARRSLRITVWVTPSHGGNVTNHATATARDTLTTHASATIQVTRAPRVPCGSAADHSAFRARGPDAYAAC